MVCLTYAAERCGFLWKNSKSRKTGRDREVFREQAEDPERAEQAEYRFPDQNPCVPFKRSDPSECQDMEQGEENLAC